MRYNRTVVSLFAFVLFVLGSTLSWAQDIQPDNRYEGYPASLIGWPKELPDLQKCRAGEYYEPTDVHLVKYSTRVKIESYRTQEVDECVWMRTSQGDRYILRPKGTKVAQDSKGRDLFDFGSPNGKVCTNPRPFSFPLSVVTRSVEVPQPVTPTRTTESVKLVPPTPQTFAQAVANVTVVVPPLQESRPEAPKGKGFCSSKTCKFIVAGVLVGGYSALAYEHCWFPYGYGRIKR